MTEAESSSPFLPGRKRVDYFYDDSIGNFHYGAGHPMRPHRVRLTHNLIVHYGLYKHLNVFRPKPATFQDLTAFHSDEYIRFLSEVTPENMHETIYRATLERYNICEDCPIFDGLYEYCQTYTGGSIGGAARVNQGCSDIVINWAGGLHHAKKGEAAGFCCALPSHSVSTRPRVLACASDRRAPCTGCSLARSLATRLSRQTPTISCSRSLSCSRRVPRPRLPPPSLSSFPRPFSVPTVALPIALPLILLTGLPPSHALAPALLAPPTHPSLLLFPPGLRLTPRDGRPTQVHARVLYIDIDIHHGDGVEEVAQPNPSTASIWHPAPCASHPANPAPCPPHFASLPLMDVEMAPLGELLAANQPPLPATPAHYPTTRAKGQ